MSSGHAFHFVGRCRSMVAASRSTARWLASAGLGVILLVGITARGSAAEGPISDLIREAGRGSLPEAPNIDSRELVFSNGFRFDPLLGEPALPAPRMAAPLGPGETGSFLVQLDRKVEAGQRERIEAAGAKVFSYVPHEAFLVRMDEAARAAVTALPFVRWVGAYHPAYKVSGWSELQAASGVATVLVLLFHDADLGATRAELEANGATVLQATNSGWNKILRARIDFARLDQIAALSQVAWIEPWHQNQLNNDLCQWVVQTNVPASRRVWDMGLHGEGQVVHTSDSGIRTSHNQFRDPAVPITTWGDYPTHRKVIAYQTSVEPTLFGDDAGASYHGTHTAGTIVGDDSYVGASSLRDGHAKGAKIWFTDIGNNSTSVFPPDDLNLLFEPPYTGNAGGAARISSNSWGSPINDYDVLEMTADQFMWNHKDFLIFFSAGNDAAPAQCGSPAGAKNVVTAGATQNGSNSGIKASFSSEGPMSDGRMKPTIMAPGDGVSPLSGIWSANGAGDTGYQALSGTSMSSPAMAGATAVVRQYCTDGWYPNGAPTPGYGFNPSAALLKAMVISSTDNDMTGDQIPNNRVGWGRIKTDNILYFPGDARQTALVDEKTGLQTSEFIDYQVNVRGSSMPLKITLVWTDKEGSALAGPQIVNDLDLTVTEPEGGLFYAGNNFVAGQSTPAGVADRLNVEEGVRIQSPASGVWTIRVSANDVPFGPQPFAIAISGDVGSLPLVAVEPNDPRLELEPCVPNPAWQGRAMIRYALPRPMPIDLAIFSADGRRVRSLMRGWQAAGPGMAVWDGRMADGSPAASGVYFYRLKAERFTASRKLIVMR